MTTKKRKPEVTDYDQNMGMRKKPKGGVITSLSNQKPLGSRYASHKQINISNEAIPFSNMNDYQEANLLAQSYNHMPDDQQSQEYVENK